MTVLSVEDQRAKIRSQLAYELVDAETSVLQTNKPKDDIQKRPSTKEKFLKNPRKAKQPGELPL